MDFFVDSDIAESLQNEIDSLMVYASLMDYDVKCKRYIQNQISVTVSDNNKYSMCDMTIDTDRNFKIKNVQIYGFGVFGDKLSIIVPERQMKFSKNYINAFNLVKSLL
ncbi:hypothetical protein D3C86_1544840 [compost metagenome]